MSAAYDDTWERVLAAARDHLDPGDRMSVARGLSMLIAGMQAFLDMAARIDPKLTPDAYPAAQRLADEMALARWKDELNRLTGRAP